MDEITSSSARSLADAIRVKELSSREIVEAYLARIDEVNDRLNAVVQVTGERALAEAHNADEMTARGESKGPLHGVPMTIKDSLDTEGIITTGGTTGRASFVPKMDSTVVARLRAAGAVLLGKTNTPELTYAGETDNLVYGRTNNPYDLSRTPGGSSGGAAAIIAAGGSPFDMGSDTGGSIRLPAHFSGIAGIKPTSGRVPRTGHIVPFGMGAVDSLTQIGPMARYVEDLYPLLRVISGPDWRDPAMVPMPLRDPTQVGLETLRIAVHTDNGIMAPTAETTEAVEAAAAAMANLGADVEMKTPGPLDRTHDLAKRLFSADGRATIKRRLEAAGTTEVHEWLSERVDDSEPIDVGDYTALLEEVDRFRSEMLGFMEHFDVIICPTCAFPAPPHGRTNDDDMRIGFSYTSTYNLTGWPGAVVRGGTSPEGLPIGVQTVARPWREDVALAVVQHLETALGGWKAPSL